MNNAKIRNTGMTGKGKPYFGDSASKNCCSRSKKFCFTERGDWRRPLATTITGAVACLGSGLPKVQVALAAADRESELCVYPVLGLT